MARRAERNGKNGAAGAKKRQSSSPHVQGWFEWFACAVAHLSGRPIAFLLATLSVIAWAVTGPMFNYSETWQLVINTSTTIVTFLMVFLIQNAQNRDTMALQIKLAELIIAVEGAKNKVAVAEDLTEEDLERLHKEYRESAEETLDRLEDKRSEKTQGGLGRL